MLGRYLKGADNSFANRGTASSYVTYGEGWAQAATAPSWLTKGYQSEGGTRAVAFISGAGVPRRELPFVGKADVADDQHRRRGGHSGIDPVSYTHLTLPTTERV